MTRTATRRSNVAVELTAVTSDGARLAVRLAGGQESPGQPTAVLSHGWAASSAAWQPVTAILLSHGYRVVTYDQRGHGDSTLGTEPVGIRRLGEDLASVIAAVDARNAVLVGHSGGGFAAMAYVTANLAEARQRFHGLVLLASAAHDQETSSGEVRMMGNALFSWALRRRGLGRKMLQGTMGKSPEPAALELNRQLFASTPRRIRADYFRCSRGMDLRAALAGMTLETLVLAGDADTVVKPALGGSIANSVPVGSFTLLPGAGHMLPLERPKQVADAIIRLSRMDTA
jgi:pimeloyl-ACP methyl ester carboxylesterase